MTDRWAAPLLLVALLAGYLVVRREIDGAVEAAVSGGLVAVAVALAWRGGSRADDLGLAASSLRSGAVWGTGVGAAIAAGVAVVAVLPFGDDLFADDRYASLDGADLAFEVLVRIPVATALFEEILFRGVGLAVLRRSSSTPVAVALSSVAFGFWHVFAAGDFASGNDSAVGGLGTAAVVAGTVVATGVAGVGFSWLRLRSGSLVAPVLVHAAINASALLAVALS